MFILIDRVEQYIHDYVFFEELLKCSCYFLLHVLHLTYIYFNFFSG